MKLKHTSLFVTQCRETLNASGEQVICSLYLVARELVQLVVIIVQPVRQRTLSS